MKTEIALIGAGGKMGYRIAKKLQACQGLKFHCVEISAAAIERLGSSNIATVPLQDALHFAQIVILAVPDAKAADVAREICDQVERPLLIVCLDPAAAYAGVLPEKPSISYFVCHPCHPMLFDPEITPEVADDFHGGRAIQDIVCALHLGGEEDFQNGVGVAQIMFAPVRHCYRISVKQMAMLEPALVETVSATLLSAIRELQQAVVEHGVPESVVRSFLLGHLRLELGIIFEFAGIPFSDGAKLAIQNAKESLLRTGWKQEVLREASIRETADLIVGRSSSTKSSQH